MLLAYKALEKDLSCRGYQFNPTGWNKEPAANCRENGFHCAENPLDCLTYYSDMDNAVYYTVLAAGDIHEDGSDSKISCTEMKLVKQLSIEEFVVHALKYISDHPLRANSNNVCMNEGIVQDKFVIVRGKNPIARGKKGEILGFAKENINDKDIAELGMYVVDGVNIQENTWYDICGMVYKEGDSA